MFLQGGLPCGGRYAVHAKALHPDPDLHAPSRKQRHRRGDSTHIPEGGAICLQEKHRKYLNCIVDGRVLLFCCCDTFYSDFFFTK